MEYIFNDLYILHHKTLLIVSVILIILIILSLIFIGIKVIKKK